MRFFLLPLFLCSLLLDLKAQWKPIPQPKGTIINSIEPYGEDVYLVADRGIFVYSSQTDVMSKFLDKELNGYPAKVLLKQNADNMFVGTWGGGVLRSTNAGSSWVFINNNLTQKNIRSISVIDDELFVCAGDAVFRSDNNGTNWNNLGFSSHSYTNVVKVVDSIYLFSSTSGMYISKDTLKSIKHIPSTSNHHILALESDEISGNLAYASPSGVYVSLDSAATWNNKTGNLPTGLISLIMQQDTLITCTHDSLFISYDLGDTWANIPFCINQKISSLYFANAKLYVGGQDHIFFSDDFGVNWISNNDSFPEKNISLDLLFGGSHFIRTYDGNIYQLSQDSTWEIQTTNTNNDFRVTTLTSIDTVVFASGSQTYISSDTLKSWQLVHNSSIHSIIHIGDTLFGIGSGIVRSVDGGLTWQDANIGLPINSNTHEIYIYENDIYTVSFSSDMLVYKSTSRGDLWEIAEGSFFHENQITTVKSNGSIWIAQNPDCEVYYKKSSENWTRLPTSYCFSNIQIGVDSSQLFGTTSKGVYVYHHADSLWRRVSRGLNSRIQQAGINGNMFEEVVYIANHRLPMANQQLLTISNGVLFYRPIADCFEPITAPVFTGSYTNSSSGIQFNLNWQPSNTPGVTHYDIYDSEFVEHTVTSSTSSYQFVDYNSDDSRTIRILASVDGDQSTYDQITLFSNTTSSVRFEPILFAKEKAEINTPKGFGEIAIDLDTLFSYELGADYFDVVVLDAGNLDIWIFEMQMVIYESSAEYGNYKIVLQATNNNDLRTTDTIFFNIQRPLTIDSNVDMVSIFPNPVVNGEVRIQSIESIQSILITAITGQILKSIESVEGNNGAEIDLSDLSKGIYFVQLKTQSGKVVKKKLLIE